MKTFTRPLVLLALLFALSYQNQAAVFYSRISGGNWNVASTWSNVTYGGAAAASFPVAGDVVQIGDGYTINITSSVSCATLFVGQGTTGILQYGSGGSNTLTVSGNIIINTGGRFIYTGNSSRTHRFFLGGTIWNFGTVDFYSDPNDVVNLIFDGNTDSGVNGSGTWDLNDVTLSKNTSTAYKLDVRVNAFEIAIRRLTVTYGTYEHNNSGSYPINPSIAAAFIVGPDAIFKVPQGSVTFSPAATSATLQGSIYVNGGSVNIGNSPGTQGLRTDQSGAFIPYLEVSSGTLTVYGSITNGAASTTEPFSFKMTGGNILLNSGTTGSSSSLFKVNDVAGSSFNMSGGTITLQKPNTTGITIADVLICGTTGTVSSTGGTIQYGNASTPLNSTFSFRPFPLATYPNFTITGAAASGNKLGTERNSIANFNLLSLYISAGTTFDNRSVSGTAGDTKQMGLTGTYNGTTAFYNDGTFTQRTGTVEFKGISSQTISGSTTTIFNNLTINNPTGVTLGKPITVNAILTFNSGLLITSTTNILTLSTSGSSSVGSSSSYVSGPMNKNVAKAGISTLNFPIGNNGEWRPAALTVTHTNAVFVNYRAELINSSAAALGYTLPGTLNIVSYMRYWQFNRDVVGNFTSATLQLYYGTSDAVTDYNTLHIAQAIGANWVDRGGPGTANGTGTITSAVINTFSNIFTLANPPGGTNALPVELISFNAAPQNNNVEVSWTTATEHNSDYFTVERSTDNVTFSTIEKIKAAGQSVKKINYSVMDNNLSSGVYYYRLRETDFDGNYMNSKSICAKITSILSGNPSSGNGSNVYSQNRTLLIQPQQSSTGSVDIIVTDMTGKNMYKNCFKASESGLTFPIVESQTWKSGLYNVRIISNDRIEVKKVMLMN